MSARLALGWAMLASVLAAVIERGNGDATANMAHPDDWLFAALHRLRAGEGRDDLMALTVAGLVVVEGGRAVKAGYLLLAMGVGTSTDFLAHAAALAWLVRGDNGDFVQLLVWLSTWLFVPAIGVLVFVPVLWPQGRISSSWLRAPSVVSLGVLGVITVAQAFSPDHLDGVGPALEPVPNPLGLLPSTAAADAVTAWGAVLLGLYLAGGAS